MKRGYLFYTIILVGLAQTLSYGSLSRTYTFSQADLSFSQVEREGALYDRVELKGCPYTTDEVGAPELPAKVVSFVIPRSVRVKRVNIYSLGTQELVRNYYIHPVQPPRTLRESPPFVEPDPRYYSMPYPWESVEVVSHSYRSEFHIVTLKVYPLQYAFQTGRLKFYSSISFGLEFTGCEDRSVPVTGRDRESQERIERLIRSLVENPEDVRMYGASVLSEGPELWTIPYLIITSDELKPAFQKLAQWMTKKGMKAEINTISWIQSHCSGRDIQEKIRNRIKGAYSNCGTNFVLLGGDTDIIPARLIGGSDHPSDLYYSDLEGSWDDNENGYFGEEYGISNLSAIQFIGSNGWVVGSGGLVAYTTNGGETWEDKSITSCYLADLCFINPNRGWAVGGNKLFGTYDGGATWTEEYSDCEEGLRLFGIDVVDANHGWAVGGKWIMHQGWTEVQGIVIHYNGTSWSRQKDDLKGILSDVDFVDDEYGWTVSCSGDIIGGDQLKKVFRTIDGGENWQIQFDWCDPLNACFFLDRMKGWAAGGYTVLCTTDGGESWTYKFPGCKNLKGIYFVNENIGWVVGYDGRIFHTEDGGQNWTSQHLENYHNDLNGVFFLDTLEGWVVGDCSAIFHTTDGGVTWTQLDVEFTKGDWSVSEYSPDIFLGRAPVTTVEEANTFVDKVFKYETDPPLSDYLNKILFLAADLIVIDTIPSEDEPGEGWGLEALMDKEAFQGEPWYQKSFLKDHEYELYGPAYDPDNPPPSPQCRWEADPGGEISRTAVIGQLNQGYHFVNHMDHSCFGSMGTGYLTQPPGSRSLGRGDVDTLHNGDKLSIVWTYGCDANRFTEDAISEHFIKNPNGGGIAFIGNTMPGISLQSKQDFQFFGAIFDDEIWPIGQAFSTTQGPEFGFYCSYNMNLLGDPAMEVWTDRPVAMAATHPTIILPKPNSFTVTATSNGNPVEGALVCLYKEDDLYKTGNTNSNGQVSLNISPTSPGLLYVTATKHNYLPYEGTCLVGICYSNSQYATAFNQGRHLARKPNTNDLHLVYESDGNVYYSYSLNGGKNWAEAESIDVGKYPCITINSDGYPWITYTRGYNLYGAAQRLDHSWKIFPLLLGSNNPGAESNYGPPSMTLATRKEGAMLDTAFIVCTKYTWTSYPPKALPDKSHIFFWSCDTTGPFPIPADKIQILDGSSSQEPEPLCYTPAITITPGDYIHAVWRKGVYIWYRMRELDLNWTLKICLNYSPTSSDQPFVEAYGDKVYVLWSEEEIPGDEESRDICQRWRYVWWEPYDWSPPLTSPPEVVTPDGQAEEYPVDSDGFFACAAHIDQANWEIMGQGNMSNTITRSIYPHVNRYKTIAKIESYAVWTEGEASPYAIGFWSHKALGDMVPDTPDDKAMYYNVDLGDSLPSFYCITRDGYIRYPNDSIDYADDALLYHLPYLEPQFQYRITAVAYQESSGVWEERFTVDGLIDTIIQFEPGCPETLEIWIPQNTYSEDCEVILEVEKIEGGFASLEELKLYQFEAEEGGGGGQQTAGISTLHPTRLLQNYPNPFNRITAIRYQLGRKEKVSLKVYDVSGRLVTTLVEGVQPPGSYEILWAGEDDRGRTLASGVYFYQLKLGRENLTRKAVLIR